MTRLTAAAAFGCSIVVYLFTLAPTITWLNGGTDSGELVTAIATLGVPHPTGFPSYILLGSVFSLLPFGELAYRVNLMSAVFAALTAATVCAIVALVVQDTGRFAPTPFSASAVPSANGDDGSRSGPGARDLISVPQVFGALTGSLLFAFSPLFWSRATVAKEYALHLWLISVVLLCLVAWRPTNQRRYLSALGIALGIGLGDHPTIIFVVPGILAYIGLVSHSEKNKGALSVLVGPALLAVIVAAGMYSYLPIRAATHPFLNWDNPSTVNGFLAHVTGSAYADFLLPVDPAAIFRRVAFAIAQIPGEYGWPGCVCLVTGAWVLASRDRPVAIFAAIVAAENILFASLYPVRDSDAYLLPAYLVGSIAVGVGVSDVIGELQRIAVRFRPRVPLVPWLAASGVALLLVGAQLQANFSSVDISRDTSARDYGLAVLRSVEPGSVILTNQDATTFSVWYAWQVLHQRPDVVVIDERLLDWNWYRESMDYSYPGLHLVDPTSVVEDQLHLGQAAGRPVYRALVPTQAVQPVAAPVVEKIGP